MAEACRSRARREAPLPRYNRGDSVRFEVQLLAILTGSLIRPLHLMGFPYIQFGPDYSSSHLRARADDALVAAFGEATADDLDRTISFLGRDKQPRTLSCCGNLLALYTHEVHHRGEVATILDRWGVENDWSSLIRFLFQ